MIRNAEGNLVNGFLLGNTNPRYLATAARIQHKMLKGVRESGDLFAHLSDSERGLIREALDNGALENGFFSGLDDLGKAVPVGRRASKLRVLAGRVNAANPLSQDFVLLRGGRALNTAIENNARLGMFLGQRAKGLSAAEASRIVRKYLFDYSDLTKFDDAVKLVSPFWTWTRKNTPLQLGALFHTPGKITGQLHALEALRSVSIDYDAQDLPKWMRDEGAVVAPFKAGDNAVAWVPDLPIFSARDALEPLAKGLGVVRGRPGALQAFAAASHNAAGLGGPVGIASAASQVAARRDIFTGRPFYPGEQVETPSYLKPLQALGLVGDTIPREGQYLLESGMPGLTKLRGTLPTDPTDKDKQLRRVLSLFTGQSVWPLGDATRKSEMYRRLEALDTIRRALAERGIELPAAPAGTSLASRLKAAKRSKARR
jgi:hypothetical protein